MQGALIRWMPKAPLDFRALMDEPTPASAYAALRMPVLVLRGEHAPRPTQLIAEILTKLLPAARLAVVEGAGHMGPLTHADAVSTCMAAHISAAQAAHPDAMPRTTTEPRRPGMAVIV